ncbi:hypothetical protein GLAREA_07099 [Glarea lozoyensis ATCC 20868]|uniref:DUF1770-domain-containing protein n=1 Tax=Glarea lozoyensis (strain ATCC 20868 / MF5171) TaxID=1116229 RepID=S3DPT6_GLAL2|nr:uncharacterized protein GLAREA_07099 [Glarea lozoyensis ATCC 20868]EPE34086.1 hypothetical protein GLAREA_07099 [Glarea lozoyensis ATCC 20868]
MADSLPMEIGSTIQSASIKRNPSPHHDLNPSTAASHKEPVKLSQPSSDSSYAYDDEEGIDEDEDEDVPYSVLKPLPRRQSFGPLPDLRFEQSYLSSIAGAESNWGVAFITIRDQLVLPLVQGMVWSLALHGWKYWNRTAQLSGESVGARARRWWYKTNNWKLPNGLGNLGKDKKFAKEVGDLYEYQSSGGD